MLTLDDYRSPLMLDEPFPPPTPVAIDQREALVAQLVTKLEAEPGTPRFAGEPREKLRALLTVRPPRPFEVQTERDIDELLQAERRSVANESELWQGDITTLAVDAVVNAANSQLLGCFQPFHPCIDNAIHSASGPRLRNDCARIMALQGHEEPTGCAKATRAYHLPSRFVFHTVGPLVRGALSAQHEEALARCYISCLELASALGSVRSLAFCAISTGVFGFPIEPAARIAIDSVRAWQARHVHTGIRVVFNVFSDRDHNVYQRALSA